MNIAPQNKPIRNTSQHTGSSSGLLRGFTIRESSTKQGAIPEAGENTPKPRTKKPEERRRPIRQGRLATSKLSRTVATSLRNGWMSKKS
jgi:hypothetical protein